MASDLSVKTVAPHVGAWIETANTITLQGFRATSRPTWARGLKLNEYDTVRVRLPSRPTWARGLKRPFDAKPNDQDGRAPRGRVD